MRKLIPSLLVLGVVLFYAGSAGAAAAPYYGAISGFVAGATGHTHDAHATGPTATATRAPSASTRATAAATSTGVPPTASPTATPTRSSTPPSVAALPTPRATPRAAASGKGTKGAPPGGTVVPTLTPRQLKAEVQHIRSTKAPQGRTNILILGSDNDQKFSSDRYQHPLTQVMIVASLDTTTHKLTLFSISRDLWVHVPGYQYNVGPDGRVGWAKIDAASKLGFDASACTVEADFGIPIDNWVWVGLNGFIGVIKDLGGATIDVPHPVMDNTYPDDLSGNPYQYRRIYIPPGPQHLNGDAALHFVRSRHGDVQGDFGRSDRQQILIDQLRSTFAGKDTSALVALLPNLLHDFAGKLKTDAGTDLPTAYKFLRVFQALKNDKPIRLTLSPPYSYGQSVTDYDPQVERETGNYPNPFVGEWALAANWDLIDTKVKQLFGDPVQVAQMPNNYCAKVPGATP